MGQEERNSCERSKLLGNIGERGREREGGGTCIII